MDEKIFKYGECSVIVTKDDGKWQLSISDQNRLPSYIVSTYGKSKQIPTMNEQEKFFRDLLPLTDQLAASATRIREEARIVEAISNDILVKITRLKVSPEDQD